MNKEIITFGDSKIKKVNFTAIKFHLFRGVDNMLITSHKTISSKKNY